MYHSIMPIRTRRNSKRVTRSVKRVTKGGKSPNKKEGRTKRISYITAIDSKRHVW